MHPADSTHVHHAAAAELKSFRRRDRAGLEAARRLSRNNPATVKITFTRSRNDEAVDGGDTFDVGSRRRDGRSIRESASWKAAASTSAAWDWAP